MTAQTRWQVSKLFKAALNKRREMPEESKGDIARWLFSEGIAVARAELEATIEQLRCELDGEKAAALNYRADAISSGKMLDDAQEIAERVIDAAELLKTQRDDLLKALEMMNRAYVNLMENGRDRIIMLGGECDPVDVMESNDPNLRESRAAIASAKGVQKDNLRSFSLRLDREEWGHVIDGLILERERSLLRKSENSESNSNEISDCCAKLIGRINRACAISTLSETPIASVKGGAA